MPLLALVRLALQRIFSQLGLMLCLLLGIAVTVALASAIPTFSDAVQLRLLRQKIETRAQGSEKQYPPFAFMLTFLGSGGKNIDYADYQRDDQLIEQQLPGVVQLPITSTTRYVHSIRLSMFPVTSSATATDALTTSSAARIKQVGSGKLSYITGFEDHIEIFGERPQVRTDGVIDILLDNEWANEIGANVGDQYDLFAPAEEGKQPEHVRVQVSGIWAATDPEDEFWFYDAGGFKDGFMITQAQYEQQVVPAFKRQTEFALWYFITDGRSLNPESGTALLQRMNRFEIDLGQQREGLDIRVSPESALRSFVRGANELTLLLVIYSVPLLAAALYFIGMVAGMVVQRQAAEIAVLRSRGASAGSIAMLYLIGGLIIGTLAVLVGLAAGLGLASVMTRLRSFLVLSDAGPLPVQFSPQTLRFGIGAGIVGIVASLLPALGAARKNIVAYRSESARHTRAPLWQRIFLDVILLVVSGYLLNQMRISGGIVPIISRATGSGAAAAAANPFADPVRFLAPVLMLAACALVLARLFPYAMRFLAWLAGKLPVNTSILLALRSLARAPGIYIGPLLLLIFTVGLAVFSSSIAHTLDQHLYDSAYFRVGADIRMVENGESSQRTSTVGMLGGTIGGGDGAAAPEDQPEALYYVFTPVEEHLRIPGVRNASRVGTYEAKVQSQNAPSNAMFVGIDRSNYAQIAYTRPDFLRQPLGNMMNLLAQDRSAVLVPPDFLGKNRLRVGDPLRMDVATLIGPVPITLTIAGTYNLWPYDYTLFKKDVNLFVGNLDWFFEQAGTELPYDVLLSTDGNLPERAIRERATTLGYNVVKINNARDLVDAAQALPERQGLFGLLSAGFIAASLLTIVGFVLSALISFRARAIQLGMLRTVGLSAAQMGAYITLEQLMLIGLGTVAGSGLGLLISRLFIPFLQVGGSLVTSIPPFAVQIAWNDLIYIYLAIAGALAVALTIMLILLRRLKAFEAIKLGAT